MSVVLDASALLASLLGEPGAERVDAALDGAVMSSINLAEVVGHYARAGAGASQIMAMLGGLAITYVAPTEAVAFAAGVMRAADASLSLGDRFCLALARQLGVPVLTAYRAWGRLAADLGVEIDPIR